MITPFTFLYINRKINISIFSSKKKSSLKQLMMLPHAGKNISLIDSVIWIIANDNEAIGLVSFQIHF